jgi:hypothetical protein
MIARTVLGIDPSVHGAIAILDKTGQILELEDMPATVEAGGRTSSVCSLVSSLALMPMSPIASLLGRALPMRRSQRWAELQAGACRIKVDSRLLCTAPEKLEPCACRTQQAPGRCALDITPLTYRGRAYRLGGRLSAPSARFPHGPACGSGPSLLAAFSSRRSSRLPG